MYLNTHSYYSLRYGTSSIDDLLTLAKDRNVEAFALTDINSSQGIPEFVKKANQQGIKPIAGIEFRNGDEVMFTGIAMNREGLKELNDYLSWHNLNGEAFGDSPWDFSNAFVVYPFRKRKVGVLKANDFIGIAPAELRQLATSDLRYKQNKFVAWQTVSLKHKDDFLLHKSLRAVTNNVLITMLDSRNCGLETHRMYQYNKMIEGYEQYPRIVENTKMIVDLCEIEMDFNSIKNKATFSMSKNDDKQLLQKLALDGMAYRYGKEDLIARERVIHELEIIHNLGFSAYFLITWDIIRYSMSRGFYHVGRGSGANSVVAYCLRITDVDPIKLNLYFERFLNPKRTSPPDFDLDFSWKERDEVQDYIFKRYGKEHTALLGATNTFKDKSITRELGKVFGLPKAEIDLLIKNPNDPLCQHEVARQIQRLGQQMERFPNSRTIHAGGIIVSEEPITYYTALDLPPKGFPTTQWDMYVGEELGFEKFDILSQRGIGHIKESVDIIRENRGEEVDVHQVESFYEDPKIKQRLRTGETTGCFYIESPGTRQLLKKLQCEEYLTLVAASSIIRPGVAKSGMMREFIRRFHNPNGFEYIHPVMKEQLSETYGVMVFQEDVIKVAHHFAGLDLAEADVLRRAMSGKFRSPDEFKRIEQKYFSNCKERGYSLQITQEVWRQIESFAGYSFSKAHSASYAVESFQSLYLKAHYPLEFMVAVINNFGGFYHSWVYFNEAKRYGAFIELPCVNTSRATTRILGKTIYMGFVHIQSMEQKTIEKIATARIDGEFLDLFNFIDRTNIGREQLILLIRVGALRFTGKEKSNLLWEAHLRGKSKKMDQGKTLDLFGQESAKNFTLPQLDYSKIEDAYDEIELIGFPVSIDNYDLLTTSFRGEVKAKNIAAKVGNIVRIVGRLVTLKYVRTVKKEVMHFGTFVDDEGEYIDTVHFPDSLRNYPFRGNGIYLLLGKVVEEYGAVSVEVHKMAKLGFKEKA